MLFLLELFSLKIIWITATVCITSVIACGHAQKCHVQSATTFLVSFLNSHLAVLLSARTAQWPSVGTSALGRLKQDNKGWRMIQRKLWSVPTVELAYLCTGYVELQWSVCGVWKDKLMDSVLRIVPWTQQVMGLTAINETVKQSHGHSRWWVWLPLIRL